MVISRPEDWGQLKNYSHLETCSFYVSEIINLDEIVVDIFECLHPGDNRLYFLYLSSAAL